MRLKFRFWSICRKIHKMGRIIKPPKDFLRMLLKMCREEFQVQCLKLEYETPDDFTICWFQKKNEVLPVWLAYRVLFFLYIFATYLYTVFGDLSPSFKYFIFLTNWTYILLCYQAFLALFITMKRYAVEKNNPSPEPMSKMPWYYKLYWILFIVTLPFTVIVTIVFWAMVYESALFPMMARNVISHGANAFAVVLDFFLVNSPVRLLHFYWPCLYGLVYTLFTVIYQFSGGTGTRGLIPIYKILDWRDPKKPVLVVFIGFVIILTMHYLIWALTKMKTFLRKNLISPA